MVEIIAVDCAPIRASPALIMKLGTIGGEDSRAGDEHQIAGGQVRKSGRAEEIPVDDAAECRRRHGDGGEQRRAHQADEALGE